MFWTDDHERMPAPAPEQSGYLKDFGEFDFLCHWIIEETTRYKDRFYDWEAWWEFAYYWETLD